MSTPHENGLIDTTTEFGIRIAEQLDREDIIWLTTMSPGGTPAPNPVWFQWQAGTFLIFSRPDQPKLRNIARNPRVALHFNSTPGGGAIGIFAGAARVEITVDPAELDTYFAKYEKGLEGLSMTPEQFRAEYSVPIRVIPDRLRGF
ncbi:TIGR03667 family PPOX class F420-dependent oxidoreductase [Nocardia sp. NPDC019395]|uniref:TIGR03667 family PPOX class F420-dependent oxidoreductase n=1 Tax=Nocardia sp. NPDC019395 TaxID=3154686 RepID=UPI0033D2CE00